jgi:DNA-binding LacI/PurR family transcriptional regulator
VSTKTVSNVVNGTGWVGAAVREEVLEAIRELGYRPNLAARQLRGGSSGLLALCVPTLSEPYFAEFASEFVDAARERGLTVLVTQSRGQRAVELAMLESENLPALDGLVFSPLALTPDDTAARRSTVPLVLIGEHGETLASDTIAHIGSDNVAAAEAATALLISRERRRIAVIGLQSDEFDTPRMRYEGYQRALASAGIPLDPALLVHVDRYTRAEGSHAIETLLERGVEFDAVFCFNDTLAFGALYTLGVHRISVPDQVQVMGYDNIEEGGYIVPSLSSVDPGVASACGLILDVLSGPVENRVGHIAVPFHVVER